GEENGAPGAENERAHKADGSGIVDACSKTARPPLSAIAYSAMIERHRVAPASRRVGGGSAKVGADPAINVSGSCDFLPMIPRANVLLNFSITRPPPRPGFGVLNKKKDPPPVRGFRLRNVRQYFLHAGRRSRCGGETD